MIYDYKTLPNQTFVHFSARNLIHITGTSFAPFFLQLNIKVRMDFFGDIFDKFAL